MAKYLNSDGLSTLWNKIKNLFVSKDAEGNISVNGVVTKSLLIGDVEVDTEPKAGIDSLGNLLCNDVTANDVTANGNIHTYGTISTESGTDDDILLGNGSTTSLSELTKQLNTAGLAITGVLNMTKQSTAYSMAAAVAGMKASQMKFYLIGDSSGNIAGTSETSVTFNSSVAALFGKGSMGASVGDLLVIAKLNGIGVYRIIPLNDAKSANGSFPGCDGLETIWDKTQINKIPSIETTSNNALPRSEALPHRGATNMNDALETGIYPWCTLGRPTGATGAFTCITKKSSNKDGNGYYTIEQTAYGRTNELGQVFKRIIFISDSDALWGDWERIDSSQAISDISNLSSKIDNSCFKCYYGEFDMRDCIEDGVYMYGTSDKPSGSRDDETFSLIVSEAGKNVTWGRDEYAYAIRQVAYSNLLPDRVFTRIILTNNKALGVAGNPVIPSEWEKVSKYNRQEENNVDYFSAGNWFITDEVHEMNPYPHYTGFKERDERNHLVLKVDNIRIGEVCEHKGNSGLYIKFYRWLSRRNTSRRWNLKNGEKPQYIPKIRKYGPGWVAMPALTQLGYNRVQQGHRFDTIFGYDFGEFNRQQKLELKCVQQGFNCLVKSHTYRAFGAQYGIDLGRVFNGYYDVDTGVALWGLKRMMLFNFIPSVGALSWGGGKEKFYEGNFSGSSLADYGTRYTVMIGLQLEYRDPETSTVTKVSPLLPFRAMIYGSRQFHGDEDLEAMLEGDIRIDINPANKGYI